MNKQPLSTTEAQRHSFKNNKFEFFGFELPLLCLCASVVIFGLTGCSKEKAGIPQIFDEPLTAPVTQKDMPETVPVYGIVAGSALEVNVEKEDAPQVAPGQRATALVGAGQVPLDCRVVNILPNANIATGMAIAWLRPVVKAALPAGDFVSAQIVLRVQHRVPTIPQQAVFIRDGKTMVIVKRVEKDGKVDETQYEPKTVKTGIASGKDVEITSGLGLKDEVVVQGGIGYLYPEFQSQAGDD